MSNITNVSLYGTPHDPRIGSCPWFWAWFFGCFYFMYKGLWLHSFVWILLSWTVVVPILYIFMARSLVYKKMLLAGELQPVEIVKKDF